MATTLEKDRVAEAPVEQSPGSTLKARLTDYLKAFRKPGDLLRVSQVGPKSFRVNWLSPVEIKGEAMVLKSYRMTKSQYLVVDEVEGELVVTDKTVR